MGGPLVTRGLLTSSHDLNEITDNGVFAFYIERGLPMNIPSGIDRGVFINFFNTYHRMQLVAGMSSIYYRLWAANTWYEWRQFTTTSV